MENEVWLKEKETLRKVIGELAVDVLWNPEVRQRDGGTRRHTVSVTRKNGSVIAEVRRRA